MDIPRFGVGTNRIRIACGQSFIVELPAMAVAGYTWSVAQVPRVAELRGERIVGAGPAEGARSAQEFEFSAVDPGHGTLILEYGRPWEREPADRLTVEVVVDHG